MTKRDYKNQCEYNIPTGVSNSRCKNSARTFYMYESSKIGYYRGTSYHARCHEHEHRMVSEQIDEIEYIAGKLMES